MAGSLLTNLSRISRAFWWDRYFPPSTITTTCNHYSYRRPWTAVSSVRTSSSGDAFGEWQVECVLTGRDSGKRRRWTGMAEKWGRKPTLSSPFLPSHTHQDHSLAENTQYHFQPLGEHNKRLESLVCANTFHLSFFIIIPPSCRLRFSSWRSLVQVLSRQRTAMVCKQNEGQSHYYRSVKW